MQEQLMLASGLTYSLTDHRGTPQGGIDWWLQLTADLVAAQQETRGRVVALVFPYKHQKQEHMRSL